MTALKEAGLFQDAAAPATMLRMLSGFWLSRAIYIAAKLGVADLVKERPKNAAELAEAVGAHSPSLYRVLRALAGAGVFFEDEGGRFHSTSLAATLETDTPGSLRFMAVAELGEEHYLGWEHALHSVMTGSVAFDHKFGMPVWEFFAENPENARVFDTAMGRLSESVTNAILASYDFSPFNKMVDVGGGYGGLLTGILNAYPAMRGVLFDLPHVIESAKSRIQESRVAERCETVSGDFFQSVPEGGDAYALKFILHDWNDEQSVAVLKNCRLAMAAGGKLLLIESVITPGDESSFSKLLDLNMMVMTGGRERTEGEYRELLTAAGFELTVISPTSTPFRVIEATRA
jgi:hypothetical protein